MLFSRFAALLVFASLPGWSSGQESAVGDAIAALQRGDLISAESTLRTELQTHPDHADALTVFAIVLDQEKKFTQADPIYKRALALTPHAPSLLNNYGNHLLSEGRPKEARTAYMQALAQNSADVNACKQVARIGLEQKAPAATACIDRLPPTARSDPEIGILEMQADYTDGRKTDADVILEQIAEPAQTDAKLSFEIGVALSAAREYAKAERFFERSLQLQPANFDALYDLGLAASHAGHKERAADVLTQVLDRQPENVNVLYDLAAVDLELGHRETALELLAHAARLAPDRAEVQRLIAYTSAEIGDFADAGQAWNRYLALVPGDQAARRERAFALAAFGDQTSIGMAELQAYVHAHANDPIGHYELGTAESSANPADALKELNRALNLSPSLTSAHVARALIRYREGNAASALPDLEAAAQQKPVNARVFDRLGEVYAALGRSTDALHAFEKAVELAPRDSSILLHLGRALASAGQKEEAEAIFARFRELGANRSALPHPAGLVDFLSLSPEEQYVRYRAGIERTVRNSPENAEAQVRYLGVLLNESSNDEASAVANKILDLKPSSDLLAEAADELLSAEQYSLAAPFLKRALQIGAASQELNLDLALDTFHLGNANAALAELDALPQTARNGDYFLARMQILEAQNETAEADRAFEQALARKPSHPESYRQIALMLIKEHRYPDAERLLSLGGQVLPDDPEITLLRAAVTESTTNNQDSQLLLNNFAARWPVSARLWSQTPH